MDSLPVYTSPGNYTLNWSAPAGATSYLLDLAEDVDFLIPVFSDEPYPTNTSGVIADVADAIRFARVRAVNACGISGYSNIITFNTTRQIQFFSLTTHQDLSVAATSFTTADYQPHPDALVLAFIWCTTNPPTTVTGNGLTWVLVTQTTTTPPNNIQRLSVWRAMGAAPTSTGLSVTGAGGQAGIIIHVQEYLGVDQTGTNGSGAIYQAFNTLANGVTIAPLNTGSMNAIVGACVLMADPTGATAEANWTEDVNLAQTPSFSLSAFCAHRLATTDNSFTSGMAGNVACLALEIINAYANPPAIVQPSAIANLAIWARSDTGVYQDAAKLVPCVADGDPVWTWDNMGNTVLTADWIQATGALQPVYNATGGFNGLPRISFNGDRLSLISGAIAQPVTIVIVANYSGNLGDYAPYLWDSVGTSFLTVDGLLGNVPYVYAGTLRYGTIAITATPTPIVAVVNGASSALYTGTISNLAVGTVGAGNIVASVSTGGAPGGTYFLVGDEYEIMVFSRALTTSEISQIQIYAKNRYGFSYW